MTKPEKQKVLLKDQFFNRETVERLADTFNSVHLNLDKTLFIKETLAKFPELEFKERISWIREMMEKRLPTDYEEVLVLLHASLKNHPEGTDFIFSAYPEFVSKNGLKEQYLSKSLEALGEFTKHFSAEFDIRFFLNTFPEASFNQMMEWSLSKNEHQRRLASEGLRPKLPWAKAIQFDYKKGASVLENLFCDKERYVVRSVANHLNDISKIDPEFVVETLKRWRDSGKQEEKEMNYLIRHALRTSVKRGHLSSLVFLGYGENPKITVENLSVATKEVALGERLEFSFDISAEDDEELMIDYKVTYATPHKRVSEKVFKIKKLSVEKGETVHLVKKHLFKSMTTKRLYPGVHQLELQVNGKLFGRVEFILVI